MGRSEKDVVAIVKLSRSYDQLCTPPRASLLLRKCHLSHSELTTYPITKAVLQLTVSYQVFVNQLAVKTQVSPLVTSRSSPRD